MRNMTKHFLRAAPAMPKEWDGHQIREYMAEEFQRERTNKMRTNLRARRAFLQWYDQR